MQDSRCAPARGQSALDVHPDVIRLTASRYSNATRPGANQAARSLVAPSENYFVRTRGPARRAPALNRVCPLKRGRRASLPGSVPTVLVAAAARTTSYLANRRSGETLNTMSVLPHGAVAPYPEYRGLDLRSSTRAANDSGRPREIWCIVEWK
jgi:hypothetical protein